MTDLVEYLRERLRVTDAATCSCPDYDVTTLGDLAAGERVYVRGYDNGCPVHGIDGTEPIYRRRA